MLLIVARASPREFVVPGYLLWHQQLFHSREGHFYQVFGRIEGGPLGNCSLKVVRLV